MKAGNQQAIGDLYDRYSPTVYAACLKLSKDQAAADERLVEVFFKLWEICPSLESDSSQILRCLLAFTVRDAARSNRG